MWLGMLYLPAGEDGETVVLCAWEHGRERPFTFAGPLDAAPQMARLLREVDRRGGDLAPPRCDACDTLLDVPPL